jgi:hypothetical protein
MPARQPALFGEPLLNQSAFLTLVWVLINNYG